MITSATPQCNLIETSVNDTNPLNALKHSGCKVCILTLKCGNQVEGPNIYLRSDLSSCARMPALRLDITLADPLIHLFSLLPQIEDIPHMVSIEGAREQLVREVQTKFAMMPQTDIRDNTKLIEIARPIVTSFRLLRPQIGNRFDDYVPWRLTLIVSFVSFFVSLLLHCAYTHLLHIYSNVMRQFPHRSTQLGRKIKTKTIVSTTEEDFEFLENVTNHPDN